MRINLYGSYMRLLRGPGAQFRSDVVRCGNYHRPTHDFTIAEIANAKNGLIHNDNSTVHQLPV